METLKQFKHIDSEEFIHEQLKNNKKILAEGAQGSLLDIDFGTYPYVTSSNTVAAGACTGLGIAPNKIGKVFGIFKAYCTRVGSGPFPTELFDKTGEKIQKIGHEFGATTGRSRRCGWLDLPALKYAIKINGVTELMMMKADVLSQLDKIKVCTNYIQNNIKLDYIPFDTNKNQLECVFKELPSWKKDLTKLTEFQNSPSALKQYISFLEESLELPIKIVSVGPNRKQTLFR